MPIPWPKILTAVTVPSGNWTLDFTVDKYGTPTQLTATVDAGTYFVAWDYQDDCLLYAVNKAMYDALAAASMPSDQEPVNVYLDSDNKVNIHFCGDGYSGSENDVSLDLTTSSDGLCQALGFDDTADVSKTSDDQPLFTGDYQHGYGWYATEDGQLVSLRTEDHRITTTSQAISYAGNVSSQQIGERYVNELSLDWLTRAQTFSRGVAYGATAVNPYQRNQALECWWNEAAQGTRFRVYRDGRTQYTDGAVSRGQGTSVHLLSVRDTNKTLETDPQEHKGRLCQTTHEGTDTVSSPTRFYINSNDADDVISQNQCVAGAVASFGGTGIDYYILDQRYGTYVLDLERMKRFAPDERPQIDRYRVDIPLLRYEA